MIGSDPRQDDHPHLRHRPAPEQRQPDERSDGGQAWRDPYRPVAERVEDLLARLTLAEKVAQLYSVWPDGFPAPGVDEAIADVPDTGSGSPETVRPGGEVAPMQHEMFSGEPDWSRLISQGLGQLTRPYGTKPVDPVAGATDLARRQSELVAAGRYGIPALVHEECLAGVLAHGATIYPVPLAWGASFDPELVERMAAQIGATLRDLGVHQGLAPVLDVTRDPRWGRTEETIGEDPYLVGTVGGAYVRGLQNAGVVATLKHFAGYSASRAGRNFGPVSIGRREMADVILPPFEMAVRAGAGSVMHSYAEVDGVPAAADGDLLTGLLRDTWEFAGTVVADYFGISFLQLNQGVAADLGEAAALALTAGVDVELPAVRCYGEPLLAAVRSGTVSEELVDRAVRRVLRQKCELGLLDPGWDPRPPVLRAGSSGGRPASGADPLAVEAAGPVPGGPAGPAPAEPGNGRVGVDLDPPAARALARQLAEESVVLLANDGTLPLLADVTTGAALPADMTTDDAAGTSGGDAVPPPSGGEAGEEPGAGTRIAVVGPLADDPDGMLGCYSFPRHVLVHHPDKPLGLAVPTVLDALRAELPGHQVTYAAGCAVTGTDRDGFAEAVALARDARLCVAVLGDQSGLFGLGTSGEGCDAEELSLPGQQAALLDALVETGTPVVLVLLAGRPYALGAWRDRLAAIVQAFFPGEEGGPAVAGVLSGRINPSGRLPVSVPYRPGGQPASYLGPELGQRTPVSSVDPTPMFPFGHGCSYTEFTWTDPALEPVVGQPAATRNGADAGGPDADGAEVNGADLADGIVECPTDGAVRVAVSVCNSGDRAGSELVQLYLHDPVAQVTRPVIRLIGYARVPLRPGERRRITFEVPADLAAFTGRAGRRIVEPGELELRLAASATDVRHQLRLRLTGPERTVDHTRRLTSTATVD